MSITTDRTDALAERLFGATLGALELCSVYLGSELGLYRTLDERGPLTTAELAGAAGIAPRYAREWLEQQAVAGLLDVDDPDGAPEARRFTLPADHARALARPGDAAHVAPFAHMLAGIAAVLPRVAECPTRRTAPSSATARATSTGPPSPTSCPRSGWARCPTSWRAWTARIDRGSPRRMTLS